MASAFQAQFGGERPIKAQIVTERGDSDKRRDMGLLKVAGLIGLGASGAFVAPVALALGATFAGFYALGAMGQADSTRTVQAASKTEARDIVRQGRGPGLKEGRLVRTVKFLNPLKY